MGESVIMTGDDITRALIRISHEIIERNKGVEGICLIGIRRRGVPLSRRLSEYILRTCPGEQIPLGVLDITLYRDDLTEYEKDPVVNATDIPFSVNGRKIILVDDVIYTGRTARAAIEAVFSFGRPASVQLVELIDRGHRELPIRPDYVGKNMPTSRDSIVAVRLTEFDGEERVVLIYPQ